MKIVINECYGGFSLSEQACALLGKSSPYADISRTDEDLIQLIETMGSDAVSGCCAELAVVEIPDKATDYMIDEYDGAESILYVVDGKIHQI